MRSRKSLPLEALRPYEVELPFPPQLLDLVALFGPGRFIELEVGFGKGAFLIAEAEAVPDRCFLGIEIDRGLERYVAARIAKRGWSHVKVICGDAGRLLAEYLPEASLAALHVYCPDPWWKKRHHKRRLFNAAFARNIARVLQPGGRLLIGTDVAAYFVVMANLVWSETKLSPIPAPPPRVATNFEAKAVKIGKKIWRAAYQKV